MSKKYKIVFFFTFLLAGNFIGFSQALDRLANQKAIAKTVAATESYINYTENKGQWNKKVLFQGDFNGGRIFLENNAFTYLFYPPGGLARLHPHDNTTPIDTAGFIMTFQAVQVEFVNCMPAAIEGNDKKEVYSNYFLGSDRHTWVSNAGLFGSVNYNNLYPGVSVKVFSDLNNVRYDFTVDPYTNATEIKLKYTGQNGLSLNNGQLVIHTEIGDIVQAPPIAYQMVNGSMKGVDCSFTLQDDILSFEVGEHDASQPLIIDPTLVFATYTGSTADNWGMSATYDQAGNGYTSGICFNPGYPVTPGAFQVTWGGGGTGGGNIWPSPDNTGFDIVISKFNPNGTKLLFSTYLGGSDNEEPNSLIVDNQNNLVVLGRTYSTNFPVTKGAYDTLQNGGADIIVSKFDSSGAHLLASTYVGGSGDDGVNISAIEGYRGSLKYNYADDGRGDVMIDAADNIYVASSTSSTNFPTSKGAYQASLKGIQDGCVFKLDSNLTNLVWSTYLGGSSADAAYNIALNSKGEIYVVGGTSSSDFPVTGGTIQPSYSGNIDGFIVHLSSTGAKVLQSTYLGTSGYDQAYFVQTDKYDNVYVYGQTSGHYPVTPGVYSNANSGQFIHELSPNLSKTILSTMFGSGRGVPDIAPSAFLVDDCSNIYISGWGGRLYGYNVSTSSTLGLPITPNAYKPTTKGYDFYFMVMQRGAVGLWYSTFFGGPVSQQHVDGGTSRFDKNGVIYQAICESCEGSSDMPTTPGAWSDSNRSSNCNNAIVKFKVATPFTLNATAGYICRGDSVALTSSATSIVSFYWSPGAQMKDSTLQNQKVSPNISTTYYVTAQDSFCVMTDTVKVPVYVNNTKVVPRNIQLCLGDSIALRTDSSYVSYIWSTGSANSSIEVFSGGPYFVVTTDKHGCRGQDSVEVLAFSKVPVTSSDTAICLNQIVQLHADSGDYIYTWRPYGGLTNYSTFNPVARPSATTTYTVTIRNGPCLSIDSSIIVVKPIPWVQATPDSMMVLPRQNITLNVIGTPPFIWTPSTGLSCTECSSPSVTIDSNRMYYIQVADSDGCYAYDSIKVDVLPTLYVPDAFTPNGDGLNDIFQPKFTGYKSIEVYIFDRWGQLIYHWTTLDGGWDGTVNGRKVQEDTYVYLINAITYYGYTYKKIGNVTVIR